MRSWPIVDTKLLIRASLEKLASLRSMQLNHTAEPAEAKGPVKQQ